MKIEPFPVLVTAIAPYIGYENAAKTAKKAYKDNISLKEACVELGFLDADRFDEVFHPGRNGLIRRRQEMDINQESLELHYQMHGKLR